jgi:hypothetical protein
LGYTGLAHIEGKPTHEWIAKILADTGCCDAANAERIIAERATAAFGAKQRHRQTGWARFDNFSGLRPYLGIVTNTMDVSQRSAPNSLECFNPFRKALRDDETSFGVSIGESLMVVRSQQLRRNIDRLAARLIGPKEALRLLVDEIIHTSVVEKRPGVGSKILGFCIPRGERFWLSGFGFLLIPQSDEPIRASAELLAIVQTIILKTYTFHRTRNLVRRD